MTVLGVDTSAVAALLGNEPGWETLATRLHSASSHVFSTTNWMELSLVVAGRHGDESTVDFLDRFANLNFGDCFSYTPAGTLDAPLLFVGRDFSQTDVRVALDVQVQAGR